MQGCLLWYNTNVETDTIAIVFGVLPSNDQLPGQVFACLDHAAGLLTQGYVQGIAVIGGYGHGSRARGQSRPEASMMNDYLLSRGVPAEFIIVRDAPVTTPEALWAVRELSVPRGHILTVEEKRERIEFLAWMIVGNRMALTFEAVPYTLTPEELEANQHEVYLLQEARTELDGMQPGDEVAFGQRYSFEYHLWVNFVEKLRREGRLEAFLAEL